MTASELLLRLQEFDVRLWTDDGRLRYSAPAGALTPELLEELRHNKDEILRLVLMAEQGTKDRLQLVPVQRNGPLPLTSAQKAMWFLQQMDERSTAYNRSKALRIKGRLDVRALQSALDQIVSRHESLRTAMPLVDGDPVALILAPEPINLHVVSLQTVAESDLESEVKRQLESESRTPFALETDRLFRTKLLQLRSDHYVLIYSMHHIISDGWSGGVFLKELFAAYQAGVDRKSAVLPELPIQFVDYADWQNRTLTGHKLDKLISHWRHVMEGIPAKLEIQTYRATPSTLGSSGANVELRISADVADRLRELARHERTTLFVVLMAAFKSLLARYSSQSDIVVGTPIANRNVDEIHNLIGYFINTLAIRTAIDEGMTVRELIRAVKRSVLDAFANQELPFDRLVEEIHPERIPGHHPVFQVMFVLESDQFPTQAIPGLQIAPLKLRSSSSMFDLSVTLKENRNGLHGSIIYKTELFDASMMNRAAAHFGNLLAAILRDPDCPIGALPMLDEVDDARVRDTFRGKSLALDVHETVVDWFEQQVQATPNSAAVTGESQTLTYHQLDVAACRIADRLGSHGVGPGDIIGIATRRSVQMIAGMLGILKSGAAYLPLDPEYPSDRLRFMVRDSGARFVLTEPGISEALPIKEEELLYLAQSDFEDTFVAGVRGNSRPTRDDLAYVIYTSGSTGEPKGVEISHGALLSFTNSAVDLYQIRPDDRVLQFASINFDTSAEEIYPCLVRGATLVLRSESMLNSIRTFVDECTEHQISVLDLPTAFWNELTDSLSARVATLPPSVRKVIIGGEAASWSTLESWQRSVGEDVRIWNTYGPTEATVVATATDVSRLRNAYSTATVPIGGPLPNVEVFVLDNNLNHVPNGTGGRLFIGGPGVARGYLRRPELTEDRFIKNPFGSGRIYDTGDRAALLPNGQLVFLGRSDKQIKIRGFRVELGEVEAVLRKHEGVEQAVVTARGTGIAKQLVAYTTGPGDVDSSEVRTHARSLLPDYMVPAFFVRVDRIPLTPSGKVDWKALPDPDVSRLEPQQDLVEPRTPVEQQLARIWERTLLVRSIGRHDNFFDLGGHSLLAVRLLSRVEQELGVSIPLRKIFEIPTIADMARSVSPESGKRPQDDLEWLVPINPGGSKPPLYCVHGFAGSVFFFRHVSRHLGPDQPVFGLQSRVLDGEPITEQTVEEIAANYLEEIRRTRPTGPYLLTAHCAGGKIALEIARRLLAEGEQVPMLILLDVVAPAARDEVRIHKSIGGRLRSKTKQGVIPVLKWAPSAIGYGLYRRYLRRPYFRAHLVAGSLCARLGWKLPRFVREHYAKQRYSEIVRNYKIQPYGGAVTLVRASESQDLPIPEDLGWKDFALGGLKVFDVPIAHVDMVNEDVVAPELLAGIVRTTISSVAEITDDSSPRSVESALLMPQQVTPELT